MSDFLTSLLGVPGSQKSIGFDALWQLFARGAVSKSGPAINVQNALRVSVAFACCRVLAEGIAGLPRKLMIEGAGSNTKRPAKEKSLYRVLARRPNSWQSPFEFLETLMYHALLCKGGYAFINRVRGEVVELLPLVPSMMRIEKVPGAIRYFVRMDDGAEQEFKQEQILHIRGPSWDGATGLEIMDLAREALGLAIATEETHAKFHKNGAKAAGVIGMDGELKPEGRKRLKDAFIEATTGDNAFKTIVLDQGAKFSQMSMTGVDAEHVRTREHQITEVCRFFRVFPIMVGYADKTATFASAEAFLIAHVVHSLMPWVQRCEQAFDRDLLTEKEIQEGYFTWMPVQALMRGDAKSRAEFYASGIQNSWMKPNDARMMEDMEPDEAIDKFFMPLNFVEVGKAPAKPVDPPPAP